MHGQESLDLTRPYNWYKLPKQSLGIEVLCGPKEDFRNNTIEKLEMVVFYSQVTFESN